MFDDIQRLRENPHLSSLFSHYAQQGVEDRATWRDRLMRMEDVEPRQLTALHGELIAFDWIEQNTGQAILREDGTLGSCYWITQNGLRDYRRFAGVEIVEEHSESPEKPQARFARKKREKANPAEAAVATVSDESFVSAG